MPEPEVRKVAVEAEVEVEAAVAVEAEVAVGVVALPRSPGDVSGSKQNSNSSAETVLGTLLVLTR